MGSLSKSVRKRVKLQTQQLQALLFGFTEAPNAECLTERIELCRRFQKMRGGFGAQHPDSAKFLMWLQAARESHDPKEHGPSAVVDLMESIDALKAVEAEERQADQWACVRQDRAVG